MPYTKTDNTSFIEPTYRRNRMLSPQNILGSYMQDEETGAYPVRNYQNGGMYVSNGSMWFGNKDSDTALFSVGRDGSLSDATIAEIKKRLDALE